MSPELLIAISGLVTAVITGALSFYNARHTARKDIIAVLEDEITRLTARIVTLEQERDEKNKQYNELQARVLSLEADNATLKAKVEALEVENARLVQENEGLQERIGELINEMPTSEQEVEEGRRRTKSKKK
jgi:chromosome segregation ATPase